MNIQSKLLNLFIILFSCLAVSCSSENEESDIILYDFTVRYHIYVVDEQGNNLIDPANPDNILDQDICVLYNGKEYPLLNDTPKSRTYLDGFGGITITDTPKPALVIGPWEGGNSKVEEFTIDWGDKSSADTFKFYSKTKKKDGKLTQELTTWLNGKEYRETNDFTIIKSSY